MANKVEDNRLETAAGRHENPFPGTPQAAATQLCCCCVYFCCSFQFHCVYLEEIDSSLQKDGSVRKGPWGTARWPQWPCCPRRPKGHQSCLHPWLDAVLGRAGIAGIRIAFGAVSVWRRVKWAGWSRLGAAHRVPLHCRQDGGRGCRWMGDDPLLLPGRIGTPERGPLQLKDGSCLSAEQLVSENQPRLEFLFSRSGAFQGLAAVGKPLIPWHGINFPKWPFWLKCCTCGSESRDDAFLFPASCRRLPGHHQHLEMLLLALAPCHCGPRAGSKRVALTSRGRKQHPPSVTLQLWKWDLMGSPTKVFQFKWTFRLFKTKCFSAGS